MGFNTKIDKFWIWGPAPFQETSEISSNSKGAKMLETHDGYFKREHDDNPLVNVYIANWKDPPFIVSKSTLNDHFQ